MSIEARFQLSYPGFALDVDLALPSKGITGIFGRSGSGKTTLLRAIAGLERVPGGRLVVDGRTWQDATRFLPVHERPIGFVFQEPSLFQHLSVIANIEYGRKRSRRALDDRAMNRILDILALGSLLPRLPEQLSGGERQRVALARSLAVAPRLMLMDEPLTALDLDRKKEILPYLDCLRAELDFPILYVSHSPDEVARLADYLVVLDSGSVVADGLIADVLSDLSTPIRLGEDTGAVLQGVVTERDVDWHLSRVEFYGGRLWVRDDGHLVGETVRLRVLARDISLSIAKNQSETCTINQLPVVIDALGGDFHPAFTLVRLMIDNQSLLARVTRRSVHQLALVPGMTIWAQIKAVAIIG